jgi:transposase
MRRLRPGSLSWKPAWQGLLQLLQTAVTGWAAQARAGPASSPVPPGAHLAQVAEPDEVVEHVPDRCGGCGADLADAVAVGVEARQVFDLPRLRLAVAEHRVQRRRWACGTTTAAAFPAHARAAACYGPGLRALVAYLCVHQHLLVDRAA